MPDPRLSRVGFSNPLGKLTAELPKTKVPEETKEILERKARAAGMGLSEYLRELAMINAHGQEYVESLYLERVRVVANSGEERG